MNELANLTRIQGELTGRMDNVERDVIELREEFKELREWMVNRFETRDKAATDNFDSIKAKLDQIKAENDKQTSFYRGAKWVALALGAVGIWVLDHAEYLTSFLKLSKPP